MTIGVSPCSRCETGLPGRLFALALGDSHCCSVRPAGPRPRHDSSTNGLTAACRMRFSISPSQLGDRGSLRYVGDTPSGTSSPSLRSRCLAGISVGQAPLGMRKQ